ncbi:MAG: MBL fold metallo-hydrolase, partial [Chloroflexi bacterium]|nr:MBL fold metallo-hydrolase [Chloroflexota bacterium]
MLEILPFTLGPAQTNAYLVADADTREAAVIDPSWDGQVILETAQARGWRIGHLWYTHAHFDHIGGAAAIADALNPLPLVALHPQDHVLWRAGGGGAFFGFKIDPGPEK